jgi:hypothetical protein
MSIITTTKRERKNITAKMCEAKVAKQTKHYDRSVSGFYVSLERDRLGQNRFWIPKSR